jgi:ubiquitin carboxyl-terminal hydrolase 25/28
MPSTFKHVREALQQIQDVPELDMTPDFFTALENEEKRVSEEIERLQVGLRETKAKLDEVWKEEREMEYELVAVFMHRGMFSLSLSVVNEADHAGKTSGAGHYWTYQAHLPDHRTSPSQFRRYTADGRSREILQVQR